MEPAKRTTTHHVFNYKKHLQFVSIVLPTLVVLTLLGSAIYLSLFEKQYEGRIYPSVTVGGVAVGGQTRAFVQKYWLAKNEPFLAKQFTFQFENHVATISAGDLGLGYDATLSAEQAYSVGRSGYFFSDLLKKISRDPVNLTPYFRWNDDVLNDTLTMLAQNIDIPVQEALFQFAGGKVTEFRPSTEGRRLNIDQTKKDFADVLTHVPSLTSNNIVIVLSVNPLNPAIATEQTNTLGIKESIGRGYSEFAGSIPGRIHNVLLTASKLNGHLIKPGEIFSFNDAIGDISAATGYQQAYIIKDGRTVLGDGGGVCQVSSTFFRAALNTGLPIIERHAHAYRVHYYEEGGFKAGLDATVYSPSYDLQVKNDTANYILIQSKADPKKLTLTIELYGTDDGRKSEIFNHVVGGITPPPPDLYQDDPTLAPGVVKQVDFAAWGAKASFQYKVTKNGEVLEDQTFFSNFRPWQAVYLRGPQT